LRDETFLFHLKEYEFRHNSRKRNLVKLINKMYRKYKKCQYAVTFQKLPTDSGIGRRAVKPGSASRASGGSKAKTTLFALRSSHLKRSERLGFKCGMILVRSHAY
jgi:hypothetical protein